MVQANMVIDIENRHNLITPDQRSELVEIKNIDSSKELGWDKIRVEEYSTTSQCQISCPGMNHHLLIYHYRTLNDNLTHTCAGKEQKIRFQDKQFTFIPAGEDSSWEIGDGITSILHILIPESYFYDFQRKKEKINNPKKLSNITQFNSPPLESMSNLLWAELKNNCLNKPYIDTLATALYYQITDIYSKKQFENTSKKPNIHLVREKINNEYHRKINLSELADICKLSQSQLIRSFKREFGQTPHNYLNAYRVYQAKLLLESNFDTPISEIALRVGFSDQSHLNHIFRKITGKSPGQYKSKNGI